LNDFFNKIFVPIFGGSTRFEIGNSYNIQDPLC
jgi:hypothetical protein